MELGDRVEAPPFLEQERLRSLWATVEHVHDLLPVTPTKAAEVADGEIVYARRALWYKRGGEERVMREMCMRECINVRWLVREIYQWQNTTVWPTRLQKGLLCPIVAGLAPPFELFSLDALKFL